MVPVHFTYMWHAKRDSRERFSLQKAPLCITLKLMLCIVGFDCHGVDVSKLASVIMVILVLLYGPNSDPRVC